TRGDRSRMPAGQLPRALVLSACLVWLCAVGACTADTGAAPGSQPGSSVDSGVPVDIPGMTMVPEAKECISLDQGAKPPLTVEDLFPAATTSGSGASQIRRGPDADRCSIFLPAEASCESAFPWAGLSTGDFLIAAGADRE